MNKQSFYREQFREFAGYYKKFPDRDLLSVFNEWCESKDIHGVDKHEIWRRARRLKPNKEITLKENSEGFVSISAVLDILLQNDLAYLNKKMDKHKESR
jgi:hypothetical protein